MKKLSVFLTLLVLFFAFGCRSQKSAEELLSDDVVYLDTAYNPCGVAGN